MSVSVDVVEQVVQMKVTWLHLTDHFHVSTNPSMLFQSQQPVKIYLRDFSFFLRWKIRTYPRSNNFALDDDSNDKTVIENTESQ